MPLLSSAKFEVTKNNRFKLPEGEELLLWPPLTEAGKPGVTVLESSRQRNEGGSGWGSGDLASETLVGGEF